MYQKMLSSPIPQTYFCYLVTVRIFWIFPKISIDDVLGVPAYELRVKNNKAGSSFIMGEQHSDERNFIELSTAEFHLVIVENWAANLLRIYYFNILLRIYYFCHIAWNLVKYFHMWWNIDMFDEKSD